eukprot:5379907-Lingulodinium_polyedra.AAC.1
MMIPWAHCASNTVCIASPGCTVLSSGRLAASRTNHVHRATAPASSTVELDTRTAPTKRGSDWSVAI